MLKGERLFIIDFQDARQGPASYDLASLLKDSIQLTVDEVERFIAYYLSAARLKGCRAAEIDDTLFHRQFQLMCIQRLLKALGTYGYQITERDNFTYEQYVAGSLQRALLALQSVREFPYIQQLVEEETRRVAG
jgi:aminoglycoside/choline kinase family phosphotransferase